MSAAAPVCDLRSDTVTRPDAAMRAAMAAAEVGDDVYGEDPTVNRLEEALAARLGKAAGLFLPSGTQSNLVAVLAHCGRGEEALVGESFHVLRHEAAGASVLGGVALTALPVEADGSVAPAAVAAAVRPDDPHFPITRLLCLENTVGGRAAPLGAMRAAAGAARAHGLSVHLDGARFFNAILALGCEAEELAEVADTVSVCLSKGLGAPVGSVLVGDAEKIARARRLRKMLGGGMRQAGVLAAAGLHALENNVTRLEDDHRRAARLAQALAGLGAGPVRQATNMVFWAPPEDSREALARAAREAGVLIDAARPEIRLVLHRDIDDAALARATDAFAAFFARG